MSASRNYEPNMTAARTWRDRAEIACELHKKAMRREFGRLALTHGISIRDARLLLMNSVQP